jgi:o-succinylbenzoate---CoA ligase
VGNAVSSTNGRAEAVFVDGSPARVAELTAALAAAVEGSGPAVLPYTGTAPEPPDAPGAAVLIATSGSTGTPKLVSLTAAALTASATAAVARLGGPGRWLLALPTEHAAGIQVVLRALLAGAPPQVQDISTGFRPVDFAAASAALGAGRRYTSLVPTQLGRILDAGGPALDALCSYAGVLIGGAALSRPLHERATAAGVAVVTTYGMTETAGGCVYDGVPLDGVTVDLEDDDPGAGGRILLGGPTLASGYLGLPAETAEAFTGGRFRTGDLGRLAGGRLEVLGRADDVIVTGGEKVAPAAVERVLAAQPGVHGVCVVGLPDAEWGQIVAAALVLDDTVATEAVTEPVRAALGRHAVPRRVARVAEIPLRGIGKPDRVAVSKLLHPAE